PGHNEFVTRRAGGQGRRHARELKPSMEAPLKPGQLVRVNLAGMQVESVTFQAAVTDAVGNIVKQTSEDPPKYLVRLLFSFRGINEVEVPADRIHGGECRGVAFSLTLVRIPPIAQSSKCSSI